MEEPTADRRAEPPGRRHVALPGGRRLDIRPVEAGDVGGLVELCAALCDEDRYRRFFSGYTPDREFFERAARVRERGGYGLVAVVSGGRRPGRIVGEASYELLPNGDGELAMMVAADWRGWLGPYLLDALVEAAAARSVPNIEADVLVTNRPMLELLRSRGYAVMPSDDWVSVRLVIGTTGRTPVWPEDHERPRALVEVPGGRWHAAAAAREAGLDVIACSG
ncbi:MAG TPA: GNAT family N-acetyltransferase, partial [Acidimicrobiales bacterium]